MRMSPDPSVRWNASCGTPRGGRDLPFLPERRRSGSQHPTVLVLRHCRPLRARLRRNARWLTRRRRSSIVAYRSDQSTESPRRRKRSSKTCSSRATSSSQSSRKLGREMGIARWSLGGSPRKGVQNRSRRAVRGRIGRRNNFVLVARWEGRCHPIPLGRTPTYRSFGGIVRLRPCGCTKIRDPYEVTLKPLAAEYQSRRPRLEMLFGRRSKCPLCPMPQTTAVQFRRGLVSPGRSP